MYLFLEICIISATPSSEGAEGGPSTGQGGKSSTKSDHFVSRMKMFFQGGGGAKERPQSPGPPPQRRYVNWKSTYMTYRPKQANLPRSVVHKELFPESSFCGKRYSRITSYIIEVSLKTNFDVKLVSRKIDWIVAYFFHKNVHTQ